MSAPLTYDGVPLWMGGNEALHSAENLRLINYMIFRGYQGVLTADTARVTPLDVPGAGIQIGPGPFVVNSKFPGGSLQSYLMRILQNIQVPTTPNLSGTTRYDLVILNVEDPYPSGGTTWPYPGQPGSDARKLGPYWRPRIIEDVAAPVLSLEDLPINRAERGYSAIPIARITRAPGTNVVNSADIKPLAIVCNPFTGLGVPASLYAEIGVLAGSVGGILNGSIPIPGEFTDSVECFAGGNTLLPTENVFKRYPKEALWNVLVPPWAAQCELFAVVSAVYQKATAANVDAHVWGETRIKLGTSTFSGVTDFDQDEINSLDNRAPSAGDSTVVTANTRPGNRITLFSTGSFAIAAGDRNKRVPVELQARQFNDAATKGKLICDDSSNVYVILKFKERP